MLDEREAVWIDTIRGELALTPFDESSIVEMVMPSLDTEKVVLREYGL